MKTNTYAFYFWCKLMCIRAVMRSDLCSMEKRFVKMKDTYNESQQQQKLCSIYKDWVDADTTYYYYYY